MADNKKSSKKKRIYFVSLLIGIVAVAVFIIFELGYYNFSSVRETWAVTTHYPNGTTTITYNTWQYGSRPGAQFHFGRELAMKETNSWSAGGSVTLNNIVCNTTDFSIAKIVPALPIGIPQETGGEIRDFTVEMTFNIPPAMFAGSFDYIFYFDYYP